MRLKGALEDRRAARRQEITKLVEELQSRAENEDSEDNRLSQDEESQIINRIERMNLFPSINWDTVDQEIEFGNISITLIEYTKYPKPPNTYAHAISRKYLVRFIGQLLEPDLEISIRFRLFQRAMTEALALLLLNRKMTPREELSINSITLETQVGYLKSAFGVANVETIKDLLSFIDDAAQSNREFNTDAPYSDDQLAQKEQSSIENIIFNRHLVITIDSIYYETEDEKKKAKIQTMIGEIVANNKATVDNEEIIESTRVDSRVAETNRRITRSTTKRRIQETEMMKKRQVIYDDDRENVTSSITGRARQRKRVQTTRQTRKQLSASLKKARGHGVSAGVAKYHEQFPATVYSTRQEDQINCLLKCLSYGLLRCKLLNREFDDRYLPQLSQLSFNARMNKLYNSRALKHLTFELSEQWRKLNKMVSFKPPSSIEDAEFLMRNIPLLSTYNLHIAIVKEDGKVLHHHIFNESTAEKTPGRKDILAVFPVYCSHYFPVQNFQHTTPADGHGYNLCEKCLKSHKIDDKCKVESSCCFCNVQQCSNTRRLMDNQMHECKKCSKPFVTEQCLKTHEEMCQFEECIYCRFYYNASSVKSKLEHYTLHCNVTKCHHCGTLYRLVIGINTL